MPEIYDIYYDESQEESYWHGFLLVPRSSRQYLLDLLIKAKRNIGFANPISFKDIRRLDTTRRKRAALVESWTSIALSAIQQQKFLVLPTPFHLGGKNYARLDNPIRCKFVIFKERDKHKKMFYGLNELECIETTFRMGLKGGIHRLFCEDDPITVGNVFIEGDKHYIRQFGRQFDVRRSLRRFVNEKRNYVEFLKDSKLIPQKSDPHKIKLSQRPDDSELLQLCDILIGGVRFHSYCPSIYNIKYKISFPCRELLTRPQDNLPRMKQSRFHNGFILNQAWIESDSWNFTTLEPKEPQEYGKFEQLQLPL